MNAAGQQRILESIGRHLQPFEDNQVLSVLAHCWIELQKLPADVRAKCLDRLYEFHAVTAKGGKVRWELRLDE